MRRRSNREIDDCTFSRTVGYMGSDARYVFIAYASGQADKKFRDQSRTVATSAQCADEILENTEASDSSVRVSVLKSR